MTISSIPMMARFIPLYLITDIPPTLPTKAPPPDQLKISLLLFVFAECPLFPSLLRKIHRHDFLYIC